MTRMTGAEAIVKSLTNQGVDTVFGLPGLQLYHLFDAFQKAGDDLQVISCRHEQGAGYMAYGYNYSSGKVGVYSVVPGPGFLNTTAALCTAYGANSKVLCLTGQIPSPYIGRGMGYLHELPDQLAIARGLTKWAERIDHPNQAPGLVNEAFKQLHTGRPRPVELEMAMDLMALEAEVELAAPATQYATPEIDSDRIKEAAELLGNAKQPLIMIGGGAIGAGEELLELAETLQAPVIAFDHGRGVISDRHHLSQSWPTGHRLWSKADVVLAIGTRFHFPQMDWGTEGLKIVRIDIDPTQMSRIHTPDVGIVADSKSALKELLPAVGSCNRSRPSRKEELEATKAGMLEEIRGKLGLQMSYLEVIREELPEDGFFVDEVTQVGYASLFTFPVYEPRHFITSGYQGTLGYGYATALGVQAANPDKRVIQVSGDGGFLFNAQELSTAVNYQLGVTTVVFKDNRFGNVYRDQKDTFEGRILGTEFHNPDFVALAESFGAAGYRATNPEELRTAIRRSYDQPGPAIIEVPIGELQSPWEFYYMGNARPTS